jgi:hypothetical protein
MVISFVLWLESGAGVESGAGRNRARARGSGLIGGQARGSGLIGGQARGSGGLIQAGNVQVDELRGAHEGTF